jgi:hypothetical protein
MTRRPAIAIVDANNVVLYGVSREGGDADETERPTGSLSYLERLCAALRRLGYDVLAIGDASFTYAAGERARAEELVAAGEIVLCRTGSRADDLIIERAQSLRALVISNDRFLDSRAHERLSGKRARREPPAGSAFGALYRPGVVRVGYAIDDAAVVFRPERDEIVVVRDDGVTEEAAGEAARSRLAAHRGSYSAEPGKWESHEPSATTGAMEEAMKRAGLTTDDGTS